jgi:hypothetical protein
MHSTVNMTVSEVTKLTDLVAHWTHKFRLYPKPSLQEKLLLLTLVTDVRRDLDCRHSSFMKRWLYKLIPVRSPASITVPIRADHAMLLAEAVRPFAIRQVRIGEVDLQEIVDLADRILLEVASEPIGALFDNVRSAAAREATTEIAA